MDVNGLISSYLSWCYRTSYLLLFGVFALFYFGLILIFAVVYNGISLSYPECINSAGSMIGSGEGSRIFGDCFQLSWTTFSTVVSSKSGVHGTRCVPSFRSSNTQLARSTAFGWT